MGGYGSCNPHMQEALKLSVAELESELSQVSNEERIRRKVLSKERQIAEKRNSLAKLRAVRQKKLNVMIILIQTIVCHELSISVVEYGYILIKLHIIS